MPWLSRWQLSAYFFLVFPQFCSQLNVIQFYGDGSLEQYLRDICESKTDVVLVDTIDVSATSPKLTVPCSHIHLSGYSFARMNALFERRIQRHKYLIYDFTQNTRFTKSNFTALLKSLSHLYINCRWCLSCVAIFAEPQSILEQWSSLVIPSLPTEFQAVFLSTTSHQVIHIQPILNGCLAHRGVFLPKNKSDFDKLKVPPFRCNLNSSSLNVSLMDVLPYCHISISSNTITAHYSMEIELLKQLEKKYNFHAKFINGKNDYGNLINGTWTGIVGLLLNGTTHLAMCEIGFSFQQMAVVDLSAFLAMDDITFMSHSPGLVKRNWMVGSAFQWSTWLAIIFTFMAISILMYCITQTTLKRKTRLGYVHISLKLLAIYLKQSNSLIWRDCNFSSIRLLYAVWMMAALILTNYYSSRFYSSLTVPQYERPIDTVADLVHLAVSDRKNIITYSKSVTLHKFTHAQPDNQVHYLIGRHMNRTMQSKLSHLNPFLFMPLMERDSNYVLIGYRLILVNYRYASAQKPLHISSENLEKNFFSIMFPKKSPLKQPFNVVIQRSHEMGLIFKWIRDTYERYLPPNRVQVTHRQLFGNPTTHNYESNTFTRLHLLELISVLFIWSVGLHFSVICFLAEITVIVFQKTKH